ncbi:hypothetical protein [Acetobacter sp.]|uniref:hypothetical protein n=1 Tax=Acetobacter sp. TaxID=440 RepID=UPI0039EAF4AF
MSGDLIHIEPPEKIVGLRTLRWSPLGTGKSVVFLAEEEVQARAMLAELYTTALDKDQSFHPRAAELNRTRIALDLIRILGADIASSAGLPVSKFIAAEDVWKRLRAAVLAEKIEAYGAP